MPFLDKHDFFLLVVFIITALAVFVTLLSIRLMKRPRLGKAAFNEKAKLMAAALDRASTACIVAAFITPETRLALLPMSAETDTKGLLVTAIWILSAVALHLIAVNLISRIRD